MTRLYSIALAVLAATTAAAADEPARMLAMPAVHEPRVAFVHDGDLWLADIAGGNARRITSADGREINPAFSPDGEWLAFSAPYAGNQDVYVMPAAGGVARRLTWHPGEDVVHGFTPDGAVLFMSERDVHTRRHMSLYTLDIDGGVPQRLPVPHGFKPALSPDGRHLAYTPHGERFGHTVETFAVGHLHRVGRFPLLQLDNEISAR